MGARQRLNSLYFMGILIVAAVGGAATESWGIFALVAFVLAANAIHAGNIRPQANPRRRPHRRFRRR